MKKILFLSLALFVAGTSFAEKKCCKDKEACQHKTEASSCSKDAAAHKGCCKKDGAHADATTPATSVDADGNKTTAAPKACCKKDGAQKACCKKDGAKAETTK